MCVIYLLPLSSNRLTEVVYAGEGNIWEQGTSAEGWGQSEQ